MGLAPISSSTAAQGADSSNSLSQLGEDYDRFLTLLTAQVQHQDPLAPMDATQFVSQLAQLSQVEQSVKTNTNLENIGAQVASLLSSSGSNLLGHEVTIGSSKLTLKDGQVDGYYRVAEGATSVEAEITNPVTNTVIRKLTGLSTDHTVLQKLAWDGKDDAGNAVLDGNYTVKFTALDSDKKALETLTYRKAIVEEVFFTEGQNSFKLSGDETVQANAILAAKPAG